MKMGLKSVEEFYEAVNKLIELLEGENCQSEAKKLRTLFSVAWTTGSELIGEIMNYLSDMKFNSNVSSEVLQLKQDCYYFAKNHRIILNLD